MEFEFASGFGYAKALIFGEYAVMSGAPALAVALTPRLHIQLENAHPDTVFNDPRLRICQTLLHQWHSPTMPCDIKIEDQNFFDANGNKYGIGSSAAMAVALYQAHINSLSLANHAMKKPANGTESIDPWHIQNAIQTHRQIQSGHGSGIDVIASALGGAVIASNCPHTPVIERIQVQKLPKIAFYTMHKRAPTLDYIYAAKRAVRSRRARETLSLLRSRYELLADCIKHEKIDLFLENLAETASILKIWGKHIAMPIIPDGFEILERMAKSAQVVIKTAGAGGGDLIIVCAKSANQIDAFDAMTEQIPNFSKLPLSIAPPRAFP